MSDYFEERYDVIAIGGSLATLSAAILLAEKGFKVLVLERHDSPGGMATSFVRDGVEYEASLHEMMSISTKQCPLMARRFLESHGIEMDWVRLPHAFRLVTPQGDFEIHAGENGDFSVPSKEIADYCGDNDGSVYQKVMDFFELCAKAHEASDLYSAGEIGNAGMFIKHREFILSAGYSVQDIFDHFELPLLAQMILSAYWIYLGSPMQDTPFSVYGYLLADYLGFGAYIPRHTSYEMSMKLALAAEKTGVQIEYCQPVNRILTEKGKVIGVELARGDVIRCNQILCGPYPNVVFSKMMDPNEVPNRAKQWVNAMEPAASVFSVILLLDKPAEELGIHDYATFHASTRFNPGLSMFRSKKDVDWDYITSVCVNLVLPEASPQGTCVYSITCLPQTEAFDSITAEHYEEYKAKHTEQMIRSESKRLGVDLKSHILDFTIATPLTISHFAGAYGGNIYGYRHTMDNHVTARTVLEDKESFIDGLVFCGAHQAGGDGMAPAIMNGRAAATRILKKTKRGSKR